MEEGTEGGREGQTGPATVALTARLRAAAPYGIIVAVGLVVTRWFWWPGGYVVAFDTYAYSGPNMELTSSAMRELRLPLINDLIFAGTVHLGNPQAGVLYPPHLLAAVMGTNRAMGLLVTVHVVALGLGVAVLVRRLGLGRAGTATAGVVAVAAGATLTKSTQFEQILVIAWIPWLLVAIRSVFVTDRPCRAVAAVAVAVAGVLLAGHPQFVYEAIVVAGAGAVAFAVSSWNSRRAAFLAGGVGLGVMIAIPQLVAAVFATADSALRGGRDIDALMSPALSVQAHALPAALLGTVLDRDPALFSGGFENIGYVGVVAVLCALVGVVAAVRDRTSRPWAIAFAAVGVLALIWSLGPRTPVFRVAYHLVPGFDLARASARWVMIVVLIVAIFAGVGADALARRVRPAVALLMGGGAFTAVVLVLVGPFTVERAAGLVWIATAGAVVGLVTWAARASSLGARRVAVGAVLAVGLVELLAMSARSIPSTLRTATPFTGHATATTEWLAAQTAGSTIALTDDGPGAEYQVPGLRPNSNVLHAIASVDGYDGGVQVTRRWADALRRFGTDPAADLPLRNALTVPLDTAPMARLGVRFVLLDHQRPAEVFVPGWDGPLASDEWFSVWANPAWVGDVVAWPSATTVTGAPADVLRDDDATLAATAIVDDPAARLHCATGPACQPVGLALERRTPEHLVVRTDLEAPAVVSIARQALPGWSVHVDGRPGDVVLVDGLFLGVAVDAGEHTIEWRYRSPWLRTTAALGVVAVVATIALALRGDQLAEWCRIRRRNLPGSSREPR